MSARYAAAAAVFSMMILAGCSTPDGKQIPYEPIPPGTESVSPQDYVIGPGDQLNIFVWRNPDVSIALPVRPDGKISTPLVEDMVAVGKTATRLARDIEEALSVYIRSPVVTVMVTGFVGTFNNQIRVTGQAANPQALSYRERMTLLDLMISVGGLAEFADGNSAKLVRWEEGREVVYNVRLEDLIVLGDITANVLMKPGDIVIIPESLF